MVLCSRYGRVTRPADPDQAAFNASKELAAKAAFSWTEHHNTNQGVRISFLPLITLQGVSASNRCQIVAAACKNLQHVCAG
jgi:hypothetical protein